MKNIFLAAVLLVMSLTGQASDCSPQKPEPFDSFLKNFSSAQDFALKRTVFPLRMLKWEFGLDEQGKDVSAPEKWAISRGEYDGWPTLSEALKENKQLTSRVGSITAAKVVLEVFQPNTDWLVLFHFRTQKGCWFFWQYEDRSL
ncbi:MAG: hypothetical protein WC023_15230 [Rhodocyclaceae bacterium]